MSIQSEALSVLDILRSIPDSVLTIDQDKRIVALNGPAEALTGTKEVTAGGRPCGAVLKSEICDTDRCPFERSFTDGGT
jgi:PAS domain-containing protein